MKYSQLFGGGNVPIGAIVQGQFANDPTYLPCDGSVYTAANYPGLDKTGLGHWGSNVFTGCSLPSTQMWTSIAFGAGVFVVVGNSGTGLFASGNVSTVCATSPDGITWTSRTIPSGSWETVIYAGGQFVAAGYGCIATSPDGITWTSRAWTGRLDYATSIAYGNGIYIISKWSDQSGTSSDNYLSSPDGITWTSRTGPYANYSVGGLIFSYLPKHKKFAAVFSTVSYSGATGINTVYYSEDGINWVGGTAYSFAAASGSVGVTYPYNSRIIELGSTLFASYVSPTTRMVSFNGGESWDINAKQNNQGIPYYSPIVVNNALVTFDNSRAKLSISFDGISQNVLSHGLPYQYASSSAPAVNNIAYGNGAYVMIQAVGQQSSIVQTLLEDDTKFRTPKLDRAYNGEAPLLYIKAA